jgi:hypothetical protein
MVHTLLDACQYVLEIDGGPISSFWLASQVEEMKLWRATEEKVRRALKRDVKKFAESSQFFELPNDEFGLPLLGGKVIPVKQSHMRQSLPCTSPNWKELAAAPSHTFTTMPDGRML